ncbi:MAG: ABC transporter ATP-binding protein/permease [Actinomycetia bacterium]|nr:ABC transporter ATP-binding protein/permease [Actinomycetes bacterium]
MGFGNFGGGGQRPGGKGPMGFGSRGIQMQGDKPRDFRKTLKKFVQYIGKYKTQVLVVMIFAVASTAFAIVGPKIIGRATTKLFEGVMGNISGTGSGIDFKYIGNIILIALGLYGASAIFSYVQGWIMSGVSMKITYRFRRDISKKINRMPFKYFDNTNQGEVLSRVTNDIDAINQTLNQSLTQIITSIATIIGILAMMLTISRIMTLTALLIVPLSLIMIMTVVKRSQKYFKQQQDYLGHVNGHVEEMFGGHNVVRAFNGEKRSIKRFNKFNNILYGAAWKSQFLSGMMMPIAFFVGNLGYAAVSVLGGWLAVQGKMSVGDILAFILYVRTFMRPISQMANISNILQQTAASAERVFEFLEEDEEIPNTTNPVKPANISGNVKFDDVRFGYKPDQATIKGFSADVKPGQKIALVGPTGAGKTTMIKLLMRFYDVDSGGIFVDGNNIKDFTREDLRSIFGMVLQDTWLYNGSIMENIRYGRPHANDEEVIKSSKIAYVDHFVHTLPNGYDHVLNEETSNISQGQKQLITIARAILADPRILILDEATSSVDTRTELLIQNAMDNIMKDRTSFIIAHRLSTIRNADLILVMDNGDIVEQGDHGELLEKDGFYANLYYSQFENGDYLSQD